jgi:hypothetical protein
LDTGRELIGSARSDYAAGLMSNKDYFDSRMPTPCAGGRCPVRECTAVLQGPPEGRTFPLQCPEHRIKIHSRTFGYIHPLRNIRVERDHFERCILNNPHKAETHRLGYEKQRERTHLECLFSTGVRGLVGRSDRKSGADTEVPFCGVVPLGSTHSFEHEGKAGAVSTADSRTSAVRARHSKNAHRARCLS